MFDELVSALKLEETARPVMVASVYGTLAFLLARIL